MLALLNLSQALGNWEWDYLLRLGLAALLGSLIGLEREHHGRSAGFRTQLLVGLGAALVMIIALHFEQLLGDRTATNSIIRADIARALSGIMTGIGFLGAGAIVRQNAGVRGLTTAASLWCTAAVGMTCGFGMYVLAVVTTAIVLFALFVLAYLENRLPARTIKSVSILLPAEQENVSHMRQILIDRGAQIIDTHFERDYEKGEVQITFDITFSTRVQTLEMLDVVKGAPGVKKISIT